MERSFADDLQGPESEARARALAAAVSDRLERGEYQAARELAARD